MKMTHHLPVSYVRIALCVYLFHYHVSWHAPYLSHMKTIRHMPLPLTDKLKEYLRLKMQFKHFPANEKYIY